MHAYQHNVMHAMAAWAYKNDFPAILEDAEYEYFVSAYVNTPRDCRVNIGYILD